MRALVLAALVAGCSPMLYEHGIPNLRFVDANHYSVGCPTKEGWDWLKARGVKTYLGLAFDDECSKGYAEAIGIRVIRLPFEPGHVAGTLSGPTQDQLHQVAAILADPSLWPIAYGCHHNQDRGSTATGVYRVETGVSKAEAFAEMLRNHFHRGLIGLWRAWKAYRP